MSKPKILEIIGNCTLGGVETYVFNYCQSMKDKFEFTFLCFDDSKFLPYEFAKNIGANIELVPNIKYLFAFNKAMNKLLEKTSFDIVHSHLNTLSVFPLRIAKKNNIKVRIAQSHALSSNKEFVRNLIKNCLKLFSRKYSTDMFAVSNEAGKYMFGKSHISKVRIIPGLIDTSKFVFNKDIREKLRKEIGLSTNDYVVGHVGRLCTTKNQMFVLQIAKEFMNIDPNYKFVFVGAGDLKEEMEQFIKKNKLTNCLMLGAKNNIYDYYNVFDVSILPSLFEGFGLVTIEAECNGLYCLNSNTFENDTLVANGGEAIPLVIDKWVNVLKYKKERNPYLIKTIKEKYDINSRNYLELEYLKILSR